MIHSARPSHRPSLRLAAGSLLFPAVLLGGELKVDINRDSKNYDNVTETGFVKWSEDTSGGAASGTTPVSKTFTTSTGENVTVTFAQTAASAAAGGTGLLSNWYQTGAQGTARLVSDGLTVAPANLGAGGQIEMTITGLSAGDHTLLTYHNAWDALAAGSIGPIDIHVDGVAVVTGLLPTIRAATNIDAANAYLHFSVSGLSDTATILFAAQPAGGSYTIRNAMINGFEIDTPNLYRVASAPSPADADGHVDADAGSVALSWTGALDGDTVSRDVYFGTDFTAVKNAGHGSAAFLGNQVGTSRVVPVPDRHATYYWRIDEINSSAETTRGTVWSFRRRTLAFPGAEGYGRFARGGRGGSVVHVTSLADYGSSDTPVPGTLRHAVEEESGPRTIVFDVSGLITLERRLTLSDDFITIAGQTAPGKGICLRGWALGLSGSDDTIVRFIRNRPGNISGQTIDGGGLAGCDHSIMDHCSISWSIDEAFSGRSAKNITLQKTLISEALNIAGHQNYPAGTEHGYAATISGGIGSYHHNLLAHCEGRNWSLGGGLDASGEFAGQLDIRNNVIYNWGGRTTDGGAHEVNFVNNYYRPGAASSIFTALNAQYDNFPGTQQYYMSGNVMPGHFDASNQAAGRTQSGYVPTTYPVWVSSPFFDSHVTTHTAEQAFRLVLSDVGCSQPLLDDHDVRVIGESRDGTFAYTGTGPYGGSPGLPNSQDDVGGWESYPEDTRPADWDADGDGMPRWWETLHGTNPAGSPGDLSESNDDSDGNGFTQLEDYLHWMAQPHCHTPVGQMVRIDLRPLALGFDSPSFFVLTTSHGSASLVDGHVVEFTPDPGFSGEAGFLVWMGNATAGVTRSIGIAVSDDDLLSLRRWRGGEGGDVWDTTSPNWWNGSLLCAWQDGNAALFDEAGAAHATIRIEAAVAASQFTVEGGADYLFTGGGSLSVAGDATTSGRSLFSGDLGLSVGGAWINEGILDFLTHTGGSPDGITNIGGGEVIPASAMRITGVERSGTLVQLAMYLPMGHTFALQRASDPESAWLPVAGQVYPGNDAEGVFSDTAATEDRCFYRVSASTP